MRTLLDRELFCIALILLLSLAPSNLHLFAIDQMRTVETYVGDDNTALTNTTVNKDFTIYIGNNISGITNPVKSVYFLVSGTYASSASATLDLKIDSDAATLQQFSLPSTSSTPTPFEVLYKDPSNKINPTSAGSYSFQLNIIVPSAITVYGLGAKVMTTYRYAPVSCDDGQPANEKIKSINTFVGDSDVSVTSQVDRTFSIYIGDNLSGVTSPIKSVYFTVSGVYSSSAVLNLGLQIDSDAATLQNFSLPSVAGTPTPFEILYKDTTNKISPASAGTYTYTLNIIVPSGITIYGLGAVNTLTYRYKPPTCGAGLPVLGELTSAVFDTVVADGAAYNSIAWKGTLVSGTKVRFQLATSNCSNAATNPLTCSPAGTWSFVGGATCGAGDWYDASNTDKSVETTCSGHNNNRYYRYKVQLCSGDCSTAGTVTSTVTDVNVSWSP